MVYALSNGEVAGNIFQYPMKIINNGFPSVIVQ